MTTALTTLGYSQGFIRCRAESADPRLWDGLLGLWSPALGPTGATLRDWGRHESHAPLHAAMSWVQSPHGATLNYPGSAASQGLLIPNPARYMPSVTTKRTYFAWCKPVDTAGQVLFAFAGTIPCAFARSNVAPNPQIHLGGGEYRYYAPGGWTLLKDGHWHSVAFLFDGYSAASTTLFIDGLEQAIVSTTPGTPSAPTSFGIGRSSYGYEGLIGTAAVYDRLLTVGDLRQLHADPVAWFQPRRRITCRVSTATPHRVAVGQVFHTGTMAGQTFNTGQSVGQVHG